jgi:hypothetical protein
MLRPKFPEQTKQGNFCFPSRESQRLSREFWMNSNGARPLKFRRTAVNESQPFSRIKGADWII